MIYSLSEVFKFITRFVINSPGKIWEVGCGYLNSITVPDILLDLLNSMSSKIKSKNK